MSRQQLSFPPPLRERSVQCPPSVGFAMSSPLYSQICSPLAETESGHSTHSSGVNSLNEDNNTDSTRWRSSGALQSLWTEGGREREAGSRYNRDRHALSFALCPNSSLGWVRTEPVKSTRTGLRLITQPLILSCVDSRLLKRAISRNLLHALVLISAQVEEGGSFGQAASHMRCARAHYPRFSASS